MFSRFFRLTAAVLCIFLVLCINGCMLSDTVASKMKLNTEIVSPSVASGQYHSISSEGLKEVSSSGFLTLYYDTRSASFAVADKSSGMLWTALPAYTAEASAVINVVLVTENGRYYLNSQDNSVAFSSFSVEYTDNGMKLTYNMSDSENVAVKNSDMLNPGDIFFGVTLNIELADGSLSVNIDCSDIRVSEGCVVENLSLLPYFGAICYTDTAVNTEKGLNQAYAVLSTGETKQNEISEDVESSDEPDIYETKGDFLLVPDGCGAVMYTEQENSATEKVSFKIYGNSDIDGCYSAAVPAFGVRKNASAFTAIISEGANLGTVKANRGSASADCTNRVWSEFALCSTETENEEVYYSSEYKGDISVCYRFMSGTEANYIDMAASCREYLIRCGVLPTDTVSCDTLPVNIEVIGSVDGSYDTLASQLVETEDMLSVVKAKGIDNVNLILQGFFENGLLQASGDSISPLRKTGGNSGLKALCEYAQKQNFNVFSGVNILTSSSLFDSARTLTGDKIGVFYDNPLSPYIGNGSYKIEFLRSDKIDRNVINIINSVSSLDTDGVCINDAAKYYYSDYSGNDSENTVDFIDCVSNNISAFSSENSVMLKGCNFYAIKEASCLLDVPFYTQYEESSAYVAVPFIPAVLHSTMSYSGSAANTSELPRLEMLKCVEYGGVPRFCWVLSMDSHLYYGLNITDTVDFVVRVTEELSDLASSRITGHREAEEGVYITSYDSGSEIYVNYNNYSVTVGNISVSPYDYVRIN